jgi:hypothetical protein
MGLSPSDSLSFVVPKPRLTTVGPVGTPYRARVPSHVRFLRKAFISNWLKWDSFWGPEVVPAIRPAAESRSPTRQRRGGVNYLLQQSVPTHRLISFRVRSRVPSPCPVPMSRTVCSRPDCGSGVHFLFAGDPFLLSEKGSPPPADPFFVPAGNLFPTRDVVGRRGGTKYQWDEIDVPSQPVAFSQSRVPSRCPRSRPVPLSGRPRPMDEPCPPAPAYRLDGPRTVPSSRGGAPSSSLTRRAQLAEPEFLRVCKQLGKYFDPGFGPDTRVGQGCLAPLGLRREPNGWRPRDPGPALRSDPG